MACEDQEQHDECKERVEKAIAELERTLFGRDRMSGVVGCIKQFKLDIATLIPKKWLWTLITTFGLVFLLGSYSLFSRVQAGELLHEQNERQISQNAEQIERLKDISIKNELRQVETRGTLEAIAKSIKIIEQTVKADDHGP